MLRVGVFIGILATSNGLRVPTASFHTSRRFRLDHRRSLRESIILEMTSPAQQLRLFNTMTRTKDPFEPLSAPKVTFYSCGPTVYDYAHVGNFRAFLMYDILKRWLTYLGFDVEHICNLTDIDDKILARMERDGISLKDLTNKYAEAFLQDLAALNIKPASHYPRATEHMPEIVEMIKSLVSKGMAYETNDSFYFSVPQSTRYGRMARLDVEGMQVLAEGQDAKQNSRDFAIWKAWKPSDGDVSWSPAGLTKGRPGWHIECSAMAHHYLGDTLDLHAGGVDLVFPHHENEIAQSEAFTGKSFATHWVHNGFVNIDSEKMSKSKGNFRTLRSLGSKEEIRAFRYLCVTAQYRMQINFTPQVLSAAIKSLKRLDKFVALARSAAELGKKDGDVHPDVEEEVSSCLKQFTTAMNDDLNTPRAIASVFGLVKKLTPLLKEDSVTRASAMRVTELMSSLDDVLGIMYDVPSYDATDPTVEDVVEGDEPIPEEVLQLVQRRTEAKASKDWAAADECRAAVSALGFTIADVKGGDPIVSRQT